MLDHQEHGFKELQDGFALMTGHNLLALHASRMGISNDDPCRKCREVGIREELEHLLSNLNQSNNYNFFVFVNITLFIEPDCSRRNNK